MEESFPLILRVYDLSGGIASALSQQFLGKKLDGIWHTGVYVYGKEYFFGSNGIQWATKEEVEALAGKPKEIDYGSTQIPEEMFNEVLEDANTTFNPSTYELFSNNCNNFSNWVTEFLVGESVPQYILDLPSEFLSTGLGAQIGGMIKNFHEQLSPSHGQAVVPSSGAERIPAVAMTPNQPTVAPEPVAPTVAEKQDENSSPSEFIFKMRSVGVKPFISATFEHDKVMANVDRVLKTRDSISKILIKSLCSKASDLNGSSFDSKELEELESLVLNGGNKTSKVFALYLLSALLLNESVNRYFSKRKQMWLSLLSEGENDTEITKMEAVAICNGFASKYCAALFVSEIDENLAEFCIKHLYSPDEGLVSYISRLAYNLLLMLHPKRNDAIMLVVLAIVDMLDMSTNEKKTEIEETFLKSVCEATIDNDVIFDSLVEFEIQLEYFLKSSDESVRKCAQHLIEGMNRAKNIEQQ